MTPPQVNVVRLPLAIECRASRPPQSLGRIGCLRLEIMDLEIMIVYSVRTQSQLCGPPLSSEAMVPRHPRPMEHG